MSTGEGGIRADDASEVSADGELDFDDAVYFEDQVEPEYGILGVTLRELVMIAAWAVLFLVSFFPVISSGSSIWTRGIDWILTIGVPTAAVFLVVLRRFSPEGIRRVGSLGIDQFASVAAAVAAVSWAQLLWHQMTASIATGMLLVGWVPVIAQLAALVLVASTVLAPLIPRLREDFIGRMETLAHRNANPVRPVIMRPRQARVDADASSALDAEDADAAEADADADADADDLPTSSLDDEDEDATRVIEVTPIATSTTPGIGDADASAQHESETPVDEAAVVVDEAASHAELESASDPAHSEKAERAAAIHYTDPLGALDELLSAAGDDDPRAQETESQADEQAKDTAVIADAEPPLRRTRSQETATEPAPQPFWILARTARDVLDEQGHPLFRIGPDAWALVIEDRDGAYVVRHDDGRIGYLHDIHDITKG